MSAKQSAGQQPDFVAEARAAFAFLVDTLGFHEIEAATGTSFDDAMVVFGSPALLIAIARERGHITADFASVSKPGQWGHLHFVLDHLDGPSDAERHVSRGPAALTSLAALVRDNLDRITPLFTPDAIVKTLARLEVIGAERLWPPRRP